MTDRQSVSRRDRPAGAGPSQPDEHWHRDCRRVMNQYDWTRDRIGAVHVQPHNRSGLDSGPRFGILVADACATQVVSSRKRAKVCELHAQVSSREPLECGLEHRRIDRRDRDPRRARAPAATSCQEQDQRAHAPNPDRWCRALTHPSRSTSQTSSDLSRRTRSTRHVPLVWQWARHCVRVALPPECDTVGGRGRAAHSWGRRWM